MPPKKKLKADKGQHLLSTFFNMEVQTALGDSVQHELASDRSASRSRSSGESTSTTEDGEVSSATACDTGKDEPATARKFVDLGIVQLLFSVTVFILWLFL